MDYKLPFEIMPKLTSIPFEDGLIALKVKLTVKGDLKSQDLKHVIIVLDKSGSMSGYPIQNAKEAIKEMIRFLHENAGNKKITFITYDSSATINDFFDKDSQFMNSAIDRVSGGGGTYFINAFTRIKEVIEQKKSSSVAIVFFTDGQDQEIGTKEGRDKLAKSIEDLKSFILKNTKSSEAHTVGFTADHDVNLLTKITNAGMNQGTFQYCKEAKDIKVCVDSISGLLGGTQIAASLKLDNSSPLPLDLSEAATDEVSFKDLESLEFIGKKELEASKYVRILLSIGEIKQEVKISIEDIEPEPTTNHKIITLRLSYVKSEVARLVQQAVSLKDSTNNGKIDKTKLDAVISDLELCDAKLDSMFSSSFKIAKTSERKDIFPVVQEIKDSISELYGMLKSLQSGQLNNDKIASLNAMAYRTITKKGLQKKLDKRTAENVTLINDVYDKVRDIVSKIDFDPLEVKEIERASKIGNCVISGNNFIEALRDEDCFCLTFDIGRSQAAIADPTQVIIKDIYPSFITLGSFLYSAQFALKKNPLAHGGFEKHSQGIILKGAAQENITGILPLYICPENWPVAKLLMKPALGWTTTLDPLGYAFSQVKTIPFLILAKLVQMKFEAPNSDFLAFQITLVLDTCLQILKDASLPHFETKLSDEIKGWWEKYLVDPSVRTIDSITNNTVFMMQLYCLIVAGFIDKPAKSVFDEFFKRLLEEELRRKTFGFDETMNVNEHLFKLLNVDIAKYIEKPVNDFKQELIQKENSNQESKTDSFYEQKILTILSAKKVTIPVNKETIEEIKEGDKKNTITEKPVFDKNKINVVYEFSLKKDENYNTTQKEALDTYTKVYQKSVKAFWALRALLYPIEEGIDIEKFKSFGIDNDTKFMCLYLQNKLQAKNADRRDAIAKKEYRDPFTEDQDFIQKWYARLIEEEKAKRITQYMNEIASKKSSEQASVFASTKNLNEAAGALIGTFKSRNVTDFLRELSTFERPLARKKIEMLVTGYYEGIPLYQDKIKAGYCGWHMCRGYANILWAGNKNVFTPEEWVKLIPSMSYTYITGGHPEHSKREKKALKKAGKI